MNLSDRLDNYVDGIAQSLQRPIMLESLEKSYQLVVSALDRDSMIFTIGNGGSTAIASHLQIDWLKMGKLKTTLKPKVLSLGDNSGLITAISNDISFEDIFALQLDSLGSPGDLLIAISSSGNSQNILNAMIKAKTIGMDIISINGFDGGKSKEISDAHIHIESENYGIIEDVSQCIMHLLVQQLRYEFAADK